MTDDKLQEYRAKRDFDRTSEPAGSPGKDRSSRRFVIQKHAASRLHYDFRLEVDGVLKSWAVPKGPSTDPRQKRLAIPTEDHPLEYGDFEGRIAAGNYGAGIVLIWDRGTYANLKTDDAGTPVTIRDCFDDGHLVVWLEGEKISGGYALVRTNSGEDDYWLLIKMDDERADARRNPVSTEPQSVVSGRIIEDFSEAENDD